MSTSICGPEDLNAVCAGWDVGICFLVDYWFLMFGSLVVLGWIWGKRVMCKYDFSQKSSFNILYEMHKKLNQKPEINEWIFPFLVLPWGLFFAECLRHSERCSGNQAALHSRFGFQTEFAWQWSEDPILTEFPPEVYCSCGFQQFLKSWRGLLIYSLRCHSLRWHSTETNPKLQTFTYQAKLHILMCMRMYEHGHIHL